MKTTDPLAIFKAGVAAGQRGGGDPRSCPWDKMTAEWNEWQRGYAWGVHCDAELKAAMDEESDRFEGLLTYLSKVFDSQRPNLKPSAGHETCQHCSGMGFMRSGEFGADRKFVKCEWCKGLGQKYLES